MDNNEIDSLYEELLKIEEIFIKSDAATEHIEDEKVHIEGTPLYDEYYGARVFDALLDKLDERVESKSALKDPDGGLTAEGRKFFKRTEGANLKPGVNGPADTPDKMRRKGSFLTRFFTNPSGPLVDEKGRATRLALSATAWGERVPKNAEDAAALAAKGRALLERYEKTKKKDDLESLEEKQLPGQTIGQMAGAPGSTAQGSRDAIDHDGDGMINDGTPEETRAPYKRQTADGGKYEKARRKFVRAELARQGIKHNARVQDRSKAERDARARARAAFDKATVRAGAEAQAGIGRANTDAARDRRRQAESDRLTGQAARTSAADRKPADRYPEPPRGIRPGDGVNNTPKPGPKPSDRKPADRYPNPPKPRDAEAERMERMRPKPRDVKPADRYPNPTRPDTKPADRYPEAPRGIRPEDGVNNRPKPSPKRTPGNNGSRKY